MLEHTHQMYRHSLQQYMHTHTTENSSTRRRFLFAAAIIIIMIAIFRLLTETFQFIQLRLTYLFDWVNWVEVILFVCCIIFAWVFQTECQCTTGWQWQIGAVGVFLAWIDLVVFIRKLPLTGNWLIGWIDLLF